MKRERKRGGICYCVSRVYMFVYENTHVHAHRTDTYRKRKGWVDNK